MNEREIFIGALQNADPAERRAYLDQACGDDPALRQRVEGLLQVAEQAGSFLEAPVPGMVDTVDEPPATEGPGTVIGPYKLLEQIGEGGFGVVFMAEQQHPVRRKVALKVLKQGMDTKQVIARFEAERQALALMDHPNIAHILDGGATASGRPYFVMDLIRGIPITDYCDQNHRTVRERLELVVAVCQAAQHAHQKGIIHRDLKPSNVLVTLLDGTPVVKVIDFGIAKAIGQRLTDKTLFTGFAQMIGTPLYMSPEQAALSSLDVDTRSDIYSLGVLLYELLTGTTPFHKERLMEVGYDELRRLIREVEPPRPSTRISTLGQAGTTVSAQRQSDPKRLSQLVRGELDWIVMKCLEKDRNRRYQTANSLALDLRRYLHDEPVEACPPAAAYRLRKFTQRNRGPVLAAALVLVALVGGIIGTTWQAVQARNAQRQAEANLRKAHQAVNDYFTLVSESTLLEDPALEPLRRKLLQAAQQYFEGFVEENGDNPELQGDLAAAYLRIANIVYLLGPEEDWLTPCQKGVAVLEDLLRKKPDISALKGLQAGIHRTLGVSGYTSQPAETLRTCEKARDIWEELVREHPTIPGFRSDLAAFHTVVGGMQQSYHQPAEAARSYRQSCDLRQQLLEANPEEPRYRAAMVMSLANLSTLLPLLGQLPQAEEAAQQAVEMANKLAADCQDVPAYQELLGWLSLRVGPVWEHAGRLEKAQERYRQAVAVHDKLARAFPTVARYRTQVVLAQWVLGDVLWATDRHEEAVEAYRQARALGDKLNPEDAPTQSYLAWYLAVCPAPQFRDARRAVELAKKVVERVPQVGDYWCTLGAALYRAGEWRAAVAALEKATQLPHEYSAAAGFFLAMAHGQLGEKDRARRCYHQAVEWLKKNELELVETRRIHAEAAELLKIKERKD